MKVVSNIGITQSNAKIEYFVFSKNILLNKPRVKKF